MKIPGFIRNDFWRKLIALLFAVVVYWSIGYQQYETRWIRNVPVEVRVAGTDLIMPSEPMNFRTDLQVRGTAERLNAVVPNMFAGSVELSEANRRANGVYATVLRSENFHCPHKVKIVGIAADRSVLELRLQRRISKEVPVEPRFWGRLSRERRLGETVVVPRKVRVTGPENDVNRIKEILTERIPLSPEIEESVLYRAKLEVPSSMTVTPRQVEVQIAIERNLDEVVWRNLPVALLCDRNIGAEVSFVEENPRVDVTLRTSAASQLDRVTPEKLQIYVDATRLSSPGVHKLNVECHIRGGAGVVRSIRPGEFMVKVVKTARK